MRGTERLFAGVALVALAAAGFAVALSLSHPAPPAVTTAEGRSTGSPSTTDDRRLERIEQRLEETLARLEGLERAVSELGTPSERADAAVLPPAPRAHSDPPEDLSRGLPPDVATRHLVLQADERLRSGTDLAGAVARYETLLERHLDVEQRIDVLRKTGLAYGGLDRDEDAERYLREAVNLGAHDSAAATPALHDLILQLKDESDRELLDLAERYVGTEHSNLTGRIQVHRAVARTARRLDLPEREKESLRYVAEHDPRLKAWAKARLKQLGAK